MKGTRESTAVTITSPELPEPNAPRCSMAFLLLLCAPRMAIQMAWAAQWAAFGPKLQTQLAPWAVQLIQLIGPTTGLIVYPMIGVFSDSCPSSYGRRRPYLLAGTAATTIVWILMMLTNLIGNNWRTGYTVVLYLLMGIFVNVAQVPASLIIADFAGDHQVTAYSMAQGYSLVGSLLVSGYIAAWGPASDSFEYFLGMLIGVLWVTVLPVLICAKETTHVPEVVLPRAQEIKRGLIAVVDGARHLPKVLRVYCICFVLTQFGYSCYTGNKAQFFGLVVNGGNATDADSCKPRCSPAQKAYNEGVTFAGGLVDTAHAVVGLFFLFALPTLVRKWGARRVFTFALLPQTLIILIVVWHNKIFDAFILSIMAITQNTMFSMGIPVVLHVIGYGESNGLGLFAGALNSANCLGQFLTFALSPALVLTPMTNALPVLLGGIVSTMAHVDDGTYRSMESQLPHCSIPFMLVLAAPRMAIQMAWAAQWAAFSPLLQTQLPSWAVQLIQIIGPTTGLLVYPTIGVFSDNCTSRFGRRRPYLAGGAVATTVVWVLMMFTNFIDESWRTGYIIVLYLLAGVSVNVAQVPASLIIADFAGDRQVTAYSIAQGYSIVGSLLVSGYISLFGPASESFVPFLGMLVVVLWVTVLPVLLFVTELAFAPEIQTQGLKTGFLAVYTGLRYLPKVLRVYCVCFILVEFGYSCYNGNKTQFFGLVVNGGNATGADDCPACPPAQQAFNDGVSFAGGLVDTLHSVVGLVFLFALPFFVRKWGARRVITYAILPQTLLVLIFCWHNKVFDATIVTLTAITQNTIFSMGIPVILHVIGYGETNGLGLFAGALNSANCLGQFITFALSPLLVTSSYSSSLPILLGGLVSLVAFLVAFFKLELRMFSL
ncbi:Glycoside-Pentoside-Hexuronide (GPH):Cation Symporter Family [Achlya hypogyna]|uniref:Glycoside-Pentoside-Hexuronide (GPH):Cation Symporter Family n=1 Tax=Achlya hypogyna TaxID=1202772 RepID=A0A1V9ZBK8_ACHHY|nr:Glycoside-Pentoside-Hexuronide (GPH):Cation Symporter Family [Achlya hypogyna]